MTDAFQRSVKRLLVVVPVALSLAACSDDAKGPQMTGAPPPRPAAPGGALKTSAKAAPVVTETIERVPNPRWETLKPYFDKFVNQPLLTHKDTFRDNLVKNVPKVDLPALEPESEEPPIAEETPPLIDDVTAGPLERYGATEYQLVMIMSGTIVPKAVVIDPIGNAWVVQKDARFGNKNGIVQNITQYAMIIQEPDKDGPVEKTIKPAIFDVAVDIMAGGDGEQRLTAAPIMR